MEEFAAPLALTPDERKTFVDIVKSVCGPMADEVGKYLQLKVRMWRVKSGVKALQDADRMIKDSGLKQVQVKRKFIAPWMENVLIEEDDDLLKRWAGLLASASTDGQMPPYYAAILGSLNATDVKLLDWTKGTMKEVYKIEDAGKALGIHPYYISVAVNNMEGHGLVQTPGGGTLFDRFCVTYQGADFLKRCGGPVVKKTVEATAKQGK